MFDSSELGVLYTDHSGLTAKTAGPVSGCAQLIPSARPAPATYGDEIRDPVTNLVADGAYF
jgi:hypothetical protein